MIRKYEIQQGLTAGLSETDREDLDRLLKTDLSHFE